MGAERAEKESILNQLWQFYRRGWIDLYFGDESAFSMNPKLPYGWSPAGERIKIFPQRGKKINLFGVFRPDNFCVTYESGENINSDFLIRSISDFSQYLKKPTVLVLDNAPTHKSEKIFGSGGEMDGERLIRLFLAKILAAFKFSRNFLAQGEIRMAAPD